MIDERLFLCSKEVRQKCLDSWHLAAVTKSLYWLVKGEKPIRAVALGSVYAAQSLDADAPDCRSPVLATPCSGQ